MAKEMKSFWFDYQDDYRSGRTINTFDSEDLAPEEACIIDFEIPIQGIRLYIVNEFPEYKPIRYADIKDDEDIELIYLKIFSHIHGFMPFKRTGWTGAYTEKGYYPDIPDDISSLPLPDILNEDLTKLIQDMDSEIYFLFFLDQDGNELGTYLLNPI